MKKCDCCGSIMKKGHKYKIGDIIISEGEEYVIKGIGFQEKPAMERLYYECESNKIHIVYEDWISQNKPLS